MKNKIKITTINDEISPDINETIEFLKIHKIKFIELRSINKKNLVDYSFDEIKGFYELLLNNNIKVSALASPLFKWYPDGSTKEGLEKVDTFNFSPHLNLESKKLYIKKAIETAKILKTKYIRIFSSLKSPSLEYDFNNDPLLEFALNEAKKENVVLLLENEIPCYINKMKDIKDVANKFNSKGLGIWFDVANFYKGQEQVFLKDLEEIKDKIQYVHLKDFDISGNYVPLGKGIINYKRIISDMLEVFEGRDIFLSIETHVHSDPKGATAESMEVLSLLISQKRISYGVVGCGQVFTKHGSAISDNDTSELRVVVDIDEKRAKEASIIFDCEAKTNIDSIINDDRINVINLRTPNDTHVDFVLRTIKNRKVCLCEKPLNLNNKEGKKILNSKFYKDNVFVNFQNRFNPAVSKLFNMLESRILGNITFCSVNVRWWRDDSYFKDWHGNKKRVGGMLFNQGAHALDIMYQVCGPIKNVKKISKSLRNRSNVDDIYLAMLEFKNGAIGNIEITTYTKYRNCEASMFIIGEKGSIKLSGQSFNKIEFISIKDDVKGLSNSLDDINDKESSHFRLIKALNEYLLTGKNNKLLAKAEDGIINTKIIEFLYK
jgi:predicted dehydrogenase/sugar phosphate isomerase/epimerase